MAQPLRLPAKVDRSHPDSESPIPDEDLARFTQLNLLIMGDDNAVAGFVASLWPYFSAPRVVRRRGEELRLLPASRPVGTILVHDVDTLTRREQDALQHLMDAGNNRVRVVSTTTQSLLPVMETGAFNGELYYRLNVLTFDLRSPVTQ